jgi:hypothetical protein
MSAERAGVDPSRFGAVDRVPDPAVLIALLDGAKPLFRAAKSVLLERLAVEHARTALGVGAAPAPTSWRWPGGCRKVPRRRAWTPATR